MAITRDEIQMIVSAVTEGFDNVSRDLKRLDEGQEKLQSTTKKSSTAWTELQSALGVAKRAYGAVAGAVRFAYQTINEGAQIQATADTFDNLAASINASADAMLGELQQASRGMVADTELMQSANRFMAMGLAESSGEAARLTEVATQLGSAMGKGPTAAMEEFALLLANRQYRD